ncbi:hypothetical protein Barb4_03790 [Bacteroidales bacterium Barb4]|nr:hypothetical protein Barb4_03790 [Bacteroidales bacterium Barb4]
MKRIDPLPAGIATAITLSVLNTVCAAAVAIWPDGVMTFFNSFAHGLDLAPLKSTQPFSLYLFVFGLAGLALVGFTLGAVFAFTYNSATRQ